MDALLSFLHTLIIGHADCQMAIAPLLLGALIGAGLGGVKHFASDNPRYEGQKKVQSETTRWSPWTGMQAKEPEMPNFMGSLMQGGMAGASFGQGIGGAATPDNLPVVDDASTSSFKFGNYGGLGRMGRGGY